MKKIHAFYSVRDGTTNNAVCFVLDRTYASHTLRVFLRDQKLGSVLHPIPEAQAARLLGLAATEPDPSDTAP
jgi:hypothetical protein